MDLAQLQVLVCEKWQFNGENYPDLLNAPAEVVRDFAIRHLILHQMKSLGVLATRCEYTDHRGSTNMRDFEEAAFKMLINAIRLTDLVGLTPERFDQLIKEYAEGGVRYIEFLEPRTGEPLYRPIQEQVKTTKGVSRNTTRPLNLPCRFETVKITMF